MYSLYARALYSKALALFSFKKYAEAREHFEKALEALGTVLEINPEDAAAWYYRGNALSYLDRPEEALEAFEKALSLEPENSGALYCKGLALGYLKRPEEALEAFGRVLEKNEEDAGAWHYKGLALHQLGRYEEALEAFSRSFEISPGNPGALYYKGLSLQALGKTGEALEAFGETLKLEPTHAGAWEGTAKVYFDLNEPKKALQAYEKALELKPDFAGGWAGEGEVFEALGKPKKALEAFEKALELDPENSGIWNEKGRILGKLERYEEALEAFETVLETDTSFIGALYNKGALLLIGESYEKALEVYGKALELEPESARGWKGFGSSFFGLRKYNEALEAYKKALNLEPEDGGIHSRLGAVYYELEEFEKALEAFEHALELEPENTFAWNGKGNTLCERGKYREALEAYETLMGLDHGSLPARYNRGVVLIRLKGRKKEYDEVLEKRLKIAFKKFLDISEKIPEENLDSETWKYRGFARAGLDQYRGALEAFEKALELNSGDPSLELCRGLVLIYLKRYEEALGALEKVDKDEVESEGSGKTFLRKKALQKKPFQKKSFQEVLWNAKGFALDALEKPWEALEAFERARQFGRNGEEACLGEGIVLARMGEWEKARDAFARVLAVDPGNTPASTLKAFALIRLQEFDRAVETLVKIEAIDPNHDLLACLLGFASTRIGNYEQAAQAYRKAVELNPKNFHARDGLAELYFRLGNSEGALKEVEASISEEHENVFSRILKGRIELEEQAYEEAMESFGRALDLDSSDPEILLWDAYARYLYAEVTFDLESVESNGEVSRGTSRQVSGQYRQMLLSVIRKLEKTALSRESKDSELRAYILYFLGFYYYKIRYLKKAAERLEECLELETPTDIKAPASDLRDHIRSGPLKPAWWEWWLVSGKYCRLKKAGFLITLVFIAILLISNPAVSTLPFISWLAAAVQPVFSQVLSSGAFSAVSWDQYGREYTLIILILLFILLFPGIRLRKPGDEPEIETHTPPPPEFDVPATLLDEFRERLEKSLLSPELMEDRIGKLEKF